VTDVRLLPTPVTETWDWQMRAKCRDLDDADFFNPDQERGLARARRDERAKAICRSCPVLAECRQHALTVREPYGIWGGMTAAERTAELARKRTTETLARA
jgi:WhiB family redox-sensing transcriptional regulator